MLYKIHWQRIFCKRQQNYWTHRQSSNPANIHAVVAEMVSLQTTVCGNAYLPAPARLRERINGRLTPSACTRFLRAGRPRARSPHGSDFVPQAEAIKRHLNAAPRLESGTKTPEAPRGLSDRRASSKPRATTPQAASAGALTFKVGGNHETLSLPPPTRGYGGRRSRLPL